MIDLGSASGGSRDDDSEIRRRRLLFRCWHCGTRELDLILGSFAVASLTGVDGAQLDQFEPLLDYVHTPVRLVAAELLVRGAAIVLVGASVLAVLKLFLGRQGG